MKSRAHWKSFSLEENLDEWIKPLVEQKTLGYVSKAEFQTQAIREKLERYIELGIHPWSRYKTAGAPQRSIAPAVAVLVAVSFAGLWALTQADVTAFSVSPLAGRQPLEWYERYYLFIDFLLYFALFGSVSNATIGRRLHHQGVALSLGLILALAVTAAQPVLGVSVRSLGSLAALVLLAVTGAAIYHMSTGLGMRRQPAALCAALLVLLGVLVYAPGLNAILQPWSSLALAAALIAGLHSLLKGLSRPELLVPPEPRSGTLSPTAATFVRTPVNPPRIPEEWRRARKELSEITRSACKLANQIEQELVLLLEWLERTESPELRRLIVEKLPAVPPKTHELETRLVVLRERMNRLKTWHKDTYGELAKKLSSSPKQMQAELKALVERELEALRMADRLDFLESESRRHTEALRAELELAARVLRVGMVEQARDALARALAREQQARGRLNEMKGIENALGAIPAKVEAAMAGLDGKAP